MKNKSCLAAAVLAAGTCILAAETVPPIACNLKALTADQRVQLDHIGKHVIAAVTDTRELKDGYAFRMDPAKASLPDVAQWLDLWRRCCPFYEFEIDLHAADASLWLSVKGRPGVKEYFLVDSPRLAARLAK